MIPTPAEILKTLGEGNLHASHQLGKLWGLDYNFLHTLMEPLMEQQLITGKFCGVRDDQVRFVYFLRESK
jgi:hypothetical protein